MTLTIDEPIQILLPLGRTLVSTNTYQKVYNNNFHDVFMITDLAGNQTEVEILINNIDQTPIVPTITYSPSGNTNQDVTVSISFNKT